jgi:hypothetical protein
MATKQGNRLWKGQSIRNYHKCMEVALKSYRESQEVGGVITFLCLGNDIRHMQLKIPLAFVLGDAKSQDHLCGRYGGHNTTRMCRACDVSFISSDVTNYSCQWIKHEQFQTLTLEALDDEKPLKSKERKDAFIQLHNHSQHAVVNAFQNIDFAGYERGIFGCTPHDLMHAFLEGVLKYCTRIFINGFTVSQKADIDLIVDELFSKVRSSEKKNMPRVNFSKGMTNLTMITADEEVGMALTILIIAQTKKGEAIFNNRIIKMQHLNSDCDNNELSDCQNDEMNHAISYSSDYIAIFEILLSFHAWYKSTNPIKWNGHQSQHNILFSIQQMLKKIKKYCQGKRVMAGRFRNFMSYYIYLLI